MFLFPNKSLLVTRMFFLLWALLPTSSFALTGNVTYTLSQAANPTTDQSTAYAKIKIAMDSALTYYNTYTTITKKLAISYDPSVATADGNSNGSIRFGSSRSYMICCTAMHEIAHTAGIGTTGAWTALIKNGNYTGANGNKEFRTIIGNQDTMLKGDTQHFWPYGLNYASEVKSTADYVNHAKIVSAMQKDLFPSAVALAPIALDRTSDWATVNPFGEIRYWLSSPKSIEISLYTASGRIATVLRPGSMDAGMHVLDFRSTALPRGRYVPIIRATAPHFTR